MEVETKWWQGTESNKWSVADIGVKISDVGHIFDQTNDGEVTLKMAMLLVPNGQKISDMMCTEQIDREKPLEKQTLQEYEGHL